MIHLDTSFLIRALCDEGPHLARLSGWVENREALGISSIAWTELLCGPLSPRQAELAVRIVGEPEPYLGADAAVAARLFEAGGRRRGSLADSMIAAVALRFEATLATANPRDFERFESQGLVIHSA